MAFCQSCGSQVEGRFCAKCGAAVGGVAPAAPGVVSGAPAGQAPGAQASGLADNVAGALCYSLGLITGILFLVLEPYSRNRNIRFHAFQSIFFSVASIIIWYAIFQIMIMSFGFGFFFVTMLIRLGFFVLWLFILLKTYQGQKVMLPVIGQLAEKQAMA